MYPILDLIPWDDGSSYRTTGLKIYNNIIAIIIIDNNINPILNPLTLSSKNIMAGSSRFNTSGEMSHFLLLLLFILY